MNPTIGEIAGPVWNDECRHPTDGYIGSFECAYKGADKKWREMQCDLYVYRTKGRWPISTCIRHGKEPADYYSPGGVENIISFRQHEPYASAYAMLSDKGYFSWNPAEPQP